MQTHLTNHILIKASKHASSSSINNITTKIYSKGTIKIPAAIKKDMHLNDGDELLFTKHGNEWAITTREKMFKDAQAYFSSHNPEKRSLVDELINERHQLAEVE